MRLTMDDLKSDDPARVRLVHHCSVTLDGELVEGCVVADEEAGYIEQYVPRQEVPPGSETWPTRRREGVVKIIPDP